MVPVDSIDDSRPPAAAFLLPAAEAPHTARRILRSPREVQSLFPADTSQTIPVQFAATVSSVDPANQVPRSRDTGAKSSASFCRTRVMRRAVRREKIKNPGSAEGFVTVSAGVTILGLDTGISPGELIEAADRGRYQARMTGRNRVISRPLEARATVL